MTFSLEPYALEVREFAYRIETNGGSISQSTLVALTIFVNQLKRTALWAKLDEIYPLCGVNIAAAAVKLKYVANAVMTNNLFADEDFEEWGPLAGLNPDGFSKYFDTKLPGTSLRDDAHLCYIEYENTVGAAVPRTALGVAAGGREWSIGAIDAFNDRSVIMGTPAVVANTPGAYSNWTSFYLGNRLTSTSLSLYKNTHLKSTNVGASALTPKPAQNLYLAARNNAGVADQFFANRLRFASVGQAFTTAELIQYYSLVLSLQQRLQRAV